MGMTWNDDEPGSDFRNYISNPQTQYPFEKNLKEPQLTAPGNPMVT